MGFSCGIVGLPNVGKSTLFNALTKAGVAASNYPFCTIEPNVGVVPVPDPRLRKLTELVPTQNVVPTSMQFVDIAGLVAGASEGEGLGNQFLGHIAEVEAIVHVVRCFEDSNITHVSGGVDPQRDFDVIMTELILKDLQIVNSHITRLQKVARSGDKEAQATIDVLNQLEAALNEDKPASFVVRELDKEHLPLVKPLNLLTTKPALIVANVSEKEIEDPNADVMQKANALAEAQGIPLVPICASIESEIAQLNTPEEQQEFLEAVGLEEPGLNRLIRAGYETLGLITFFTVGEKENRAWTVRKDATAPEAAGKIHTDIQRGFIRAEIIGYDDFVTCGSESVAKDQGKLRIEGKEYLMQDGDVTHFRFNV